MEMDMRRRRLGCDDVTDALLHAALELMPTLGLGAVSQV
jgi:hypothetical protein